MIVDPIIESPYGLYILGSDDDELAQQLAAYSASMHGQSISCFSNDFCRREIGKFNIDQAAAQSVMPMEDPLPQGAVPRGGTKPQPAAHNMQRNLNLSEYDLLKDDEAKGGALLGTALQPVPTLGTLNKGLPHSLLPQLRVNAGGHLQVEQYLTQRRKNPDAFIEVPKSLKFEPPGYPVDNKGAPLHHRYSKKEKEDLCTACHLPAIGRVNLSHHHSPPGLLPNFPMGVDAPNWNQSILASQRLRDVKMSCSTDTCGLYVFSRVSHCHMWNLSSNAEMEDDTEYRYGPLADQWSSPEQYLEEYRDSDHAELIALGELSRYLSKYGNLMGKATPDDLKSYLRDLFKLSQDSCTHHNTECLPFPPADFTDFEAERIYGGSNSIRASSLLSVGQSFLARSRDPSMRVSMAHGV